MVDVNSACLLEWPAVQNPKYDISNNTEHREATHPDVWAAISNQLGFSLFQFILNHFSPTM